MKYLGISLSLNTNWARTYWGAAALVLTFLISALAISVINPVVSLFGSWLAAILWVCLAPYSPTPLPYARGDRYRMVAVAGALSLLHLGYGAVLLLYEPVGLSSRDPVLVAYALAGTLLFVTLVTANTAYWARPVGRPLVHDDIARLEDAWISRRRDQAGMAADRPRFGLALSGGGIRSASVSAGFLAALHSTGRSNQLDYISAVSGGTWPSAAWFAAAGAHRPVDADFFRNTLLKNRKYLSWQSLFLIGIRGLVLLLVWILVPFAVVTCIIAMIDLIGLGDDYTSQIRVFVRKFEDLMNILGANEEALGVWNIVSRARLGLYGLVTLALASSAAFLGFFVGAYLASGVRSAWGKGISRTPLFIGTTAIAIIGIMYSANVLNYLVVLILAGYLAANSRSRLRVWIISPLILIMLCFSLRIIELSALPEGFLQVIWWPFDALVGLLSGLARVDPLAVFFIVLALPIVAVAGWAVIGGPVGPFSFWRRTLSQAFVVPESRRKGLPLARPAPSGAEPLLLINAAVYLPGSTNAQVVADGGRARFEFSPLAIGGPGTNWVAADQYGRRFGLSTAITASSAIISSRRASVEALLSYTGIHLSRWFPNPAFFGDERWHVRSWARRGFEAVSQLFEITSEHRPRVVVADGGFDENLGITALADRGVAQILSLDATRDRWFDYSDLERAIRALNRRGWTLADRTPAPVKGEPPLEVVTPLTFTAASGRELTVFYVKARRLAEAEATVPPAVATFLETAKAFPHDRTFNQWFSKAQMEAYVWLGEVLGQRAVQFLNDDAKRDRAGTPFSTGDPA